mgnify:FL=1
MLLVAVSVAICNTHLMRMRGMGRERHSIYGTNRRLGADNSHPLSFAMQPLVKHDYEQNRIYEKKYLEYQYQLEMSRK